MSVKQLFLGGARSGKSRLAEVAAQDSGLSLIYIATGQAGDLEMAERIVHHQERRSSQWRLIEEPVHLADALIKNAAPDSCILVDCLTLWLSNCLIEDESLAVWEKQREALLNVVEELPGDVIFVGNETGMGVVPMGKLSRQFVDENGWLHQSLAQICDRVTLTVAGLPHCLKNTK